jgi:hypothetical protein
VKERREERGDVGVNALFFYTHIPIFFFVVMVAENIDMRECKQEHMPNKFLCPVGTRKRVCV